MSFEIASGLHERRKSKKKAKRKSIYDRQREEETIKNAVDRGYLRRMTVEFLNDNVGLDGRDLPLVGYLNVTSQQLSSLGALEMCVSLRICILPGNYITEFDALAGCVNLWALDLHGNQIKKVPGHKFWSALNQLQIALLHDNGISKLETIHHLSSSPSLAILTLYDTPLSLKKNYRHHVVNGVWSLKALDSHVVSDEEIIEDIKMPGRFSAMHKHFKVDLTHTLTKASSMKHAVKQMEELKRKVNKIQAKYCPVLMIQKTFRMYAIRKRYKYLLATRVWAATSIQRFYRFHKGITKSLEEILPPPTSPFVPPGYNGNSSSHDRESGDDSGGMEQYDSNSSRRTKESSVHIPNANYISVVGDGGSSRSVAASKTPTDLSKISTDLSKMSTDLSKISQDRSKISTDIMMRSSLDSRRYKSNPAANLDEASSREQSFQEQKIVTRMTIDLVKLESSAMGTIESATCDIAVDGSFGLDKKSKWPKDSKSKISVDINKEDTIWIEQRKRESHEQVDALYKRRLKPEMVGKYRTVRVFLGSVVEPKTEREIFTDSDEDETIGFRLQGGEPPKQKNEPIAEMLLSKKEMGEDVRKSLRQFRRKQPDKRNKVSGRATKLTNDQKLFLRTHGTMGLACLRAVHQAYEDRTRSQRQIALNERVSEMKECRELGIERLQSMKQEYQENILRERIQDGVRIADSLRENEAKQNKERRKVSERRTAALVQNRIRQSHFAFARDFACQQNSVSQALRSHDRAEAKKEKQKQMVEAVRAERKSNLEKQELVKKYMEHRRLMSQAEMSKARAEINTKLLEEANKQFMEVEANMKRAKTRQSKVAELCPLPPLYAPNLTSPLAVLSPAMVTQWEECLQRDSRHFDDVFPMTSSENVF